MWGGACGGMCVSVCGCVFFGGDMSLVRIFGDEGGCIT